MYLDDEVLVRKSLCGDTNAFGQLVEKYQGVAYRIAYRQVNNHHDAEEIVQEAFLLAYRKLKTLKNPRTFASWLYAITNNQCKSFKRKERRKVETIPLGEAITSMIPVSLQRFLQQEERALLWEAIRALSEKPKRLLTLFYRDGLSTKEIGEQMGMSQNQVLVELHRARHQLKEEFIMARKNHTKGILPRSFPQQIIEAVRKQPAPSSPPVGWRIGGPALATASLIVALTLGFGMGKLPNQLPTFNMPNGDEAPTSIFLVMDSEAKPSLIAQNLVNPPSQETHTLPADEPGAIVWGSGLNIEGVVQIAEPISQGRSLWASGKSPGAFESWMNERTKIRLQFMNRQIALDSPDLLKQPMLLISGNKPIELTESERENLSTYLVEKGGFLIVDEIPGDAGGFTESVAASLKTILPKGETKPISNEHEIYNCFYQFGGPPEGKALSGTFVDGALVALYSDQNYWAYLTAEVTPWTETQQTQLKQLRQSKPSQPLPDWAMPYLRSMATRRFFSNLVVYTITRGSIADYSAYQF